MVFNLCKFADKTISSEYVLERPPKKPGGISSAMFLVLVMNLCLHDNGVEVSKLEGSHPPVAEKDYLSYLLVVGICMTLFVAIVMSLLIFLFSWFKYVEGVEQSRHVFLVKECMATGTWGDNLKYVQKKKSCLQIDAIIYLAKTNIKMECFDGSDREDEVSLEGSPIFLREFFDIETDFWIAQFGINYNNCYDEVLSALWNMFLHGTSLSVDDKSTVMTTAESLDLSLDAFSINKLVG